MNSKKRVFVYIRVGNPEQLTEQKERLSKYCEAMDWEIENVFADIGNYSGLNFDRPKLQEMISEIKKGGKSDMVLVDSIDRLSRNPYKNANLIFGVFKENGCDFASRSEILNTATLPGVAMASLMAGAY